MMQKGRFGIPMLWYCYLGLGLAAFQQLFLLALLFLFLYLFERDDWCCRQVIQVMLAVLFIQIIGMVLRWVLYMFLAVPLVGGLLAGTGIFTVRSVLWGILVLFCLRAAYRLYQGQDSDFPVISALADRIVLFR